MMLRWPIPVILFQVLSLESLINTFTQHLCSQHLQSAPFAQRFHSTPSLCSFYSTPLINVFHLTPLLHTFYSTPSLHTFYSTPSNHLSLKTLTHPHTPAYLQYYPTLSDPLSDPFPRVKQHRRELPTAYNTRTLATLPAAYNRRTLATQYAASQAPGCLLYRCLDPCMWKAPSVCQSYAHSTASPPLPEPPGPRCTPEPSRDWKPGQKDQGALEKWENVCVSSDRYSDAVFCSGVLWSWGGSAAPPPPHSSAS